MILPRLENTIRSGDIRSSIDPVGIAVVIGRKFAGSLLAWAVAGLGRSKLWFESDSVSFFVEVS